MINEHHINKPMQMVELNLTMFFAKKPQLINSLDRSINHTLIREYSNILLNVQ